MNNTKLAENLKDDIRQLTARLNIPAAVICKDVTLAETPEIHQHENYELRLHLAPDEKSFSHVDVIHPEILHRQLTTEESLRTMTVIFHSGCFRYRHKDSAMTFMHSPYMCEVTGLLDRFTPDDTGELLLTLALMLHKSFPAGDLREKERITRAIRYLEQHYYRQDLTIVSLAEIAGYSPNYLQKLFTAATGYRPKEYLQNYRMQMAAGFLKKKRYLVKEVAAMCGYSDAHYFANVFRRHYGCPPGDFAGMQD